MVCRGHVVSSWDKGLRFLGPTVSLPPDPPVKGKEIDPLITHEAVREGLPAASAAQPPSAWCGQRARVSACVWVRVCAFRVCPLRNIEKHPQIPHSGSEPAPGGGHQRFARMD